MSSEITTVISLKIKRKLEEWAKIFDSKEVDLRHSEFDIKPLFGGFSKDETQKFICIKEALEGNIQKFGYVNNGRIKSHNVYFSTIESSWI